MSASPSTSPPRTPGDNRFPSTSKSTTPNSDDSSIIDDLSFDYIFDKDGNIVRLSKGLSPKSNQSSPPTPQEVALQPDTLKPPSPDSLASPVTRITLSRSESAFPAPSGSAAGSSSQLQNDKPARLFQRVASGSSLVAPSYLAPTASSLSKPRIGLRRTTMEDPRERSDSVSSSRARQTLDPHPYALQEEKENISESDENPYGNQTAATGTKQRGSPPLASRLVSSSSTRLAASRAAYLTGGSGSGSRPLTDLPPQRGPRQISVGSNRPGRIMKSTSSRSINFDRISEIENNENELGGHSPMTALGDDTEPEDELAISGDPPIPLSLNPSGISRSRTQTASGISVNTNLAQSGVTRPRRSASLSEGLQNDEYQLQVQQQYQNSSSRPGTSLGVNGENNTAGARRITTQQRERQDMEMRAEYQKYLSQDGPDRREQNGHLHQSRQSPSPTSQQHLKTSRPAYGHKRRDSDTLRNAAPSLGSPTVIEHSRASPPLSARLQVRYSPQDVSKGRTSPSTTKGRVSPPTIRGRVSPPNIRASKEIPKHRRSPTAPEPPTTNGLVRDASGSSQPIGKTWGGGDRANKEDDFDGDAAAILGERDRDRERERERERERDRDRERERRGHQSQLSLQHPPSQPQYSLSAPTIAAAQAQPTPGQLNRHIVVNKKAYARLDMIGKGGSSRVFRVLNHANELYAIKRVSLDKTDAETMSGYMNEIALLKRLEGNNRIIRLIDSEVKPGPGGSKGHLLLVMECGEIDLARLLQEQMKEPVNMVWVAYYWQQMLQAVHVIHEEKIVHSDLKPANFVLVRGQLKLIDFGIANAIANDTTNIQRDHQIGTVNYMSPEAIELPDGMRHLKVGRPSDVWSLGCILYQMVYGHPPFQHLSVYQKMKAIPDLTHVIDFAEYATPTVPSPRNSTSGNGQIDPPKKLDHLKQRVRKDVIMSMKSCLCRNPKERATIPDLLNHSWLANQEPSVPSVKELLQEDETIINPYYMRQLLEYGVKLASEGGANPEALLKDAERLVQELKAIQAVQP